MNVKLFLFSLLLLFAERSFGTAVPIINIPSAIGAPNETVCVDVQVANFTDITAMELELKWGNQGFDYQEVRNVNLPGLNPSQFDFSPSTGLYVYWENIGSGVTLSNGTSIFQICMEFKNNCNTNIEPMQLNFFTAGNPGTPIAGELKGAKLFNSDCYANESGNFKLAASTTIGKLGETVAVNLSTKNFTDVNALTYSLHYDTQHLRFVGLTNFGIPGLSLEDFAVPADGSTSTQNTTEEGTITMNWEDPLFDGQTLQDDALIVTVLFEIVGQPGDNSNIYFSNSPQTIQATNATTGDLYFDLQSGTINITADALSVANVSTQNATCASLQDGQIALDVTGGVPPYTYQWSGPDGFTATVEDLVQISAGNYAVTITDSAENSVIAGPYLIDAPNYTINLTYSDTKVCPGLEVFLSASSTEQVTYTWTSKQGKVKFLCNECSETFASSAEGLDPGIYYDTIQVTTTSLGCETRAELPITVSVIQFDIAETFEVCLGDSLEIRPETAFDPEGSYVWYGENEFASNDYALQAANFTVAQSGLYSIGYTNKVGCLVKDGTNVTINPIPDLTATTVTDKICEGSETGLISLSVPPVNTPYSVFWSNNQLVFTETEAVLENLAAGEYRATYKDNKGCGKTLTFKIDTYAPIEANVTVTNACGNEDNGKLKVNVTNGEGPFYFNWGQETSNEITNLTPENYAVTITDAGNCQKVIETTVKRTNIISVSQDSTIEIGESVPLVAAVENAATIQWSPETGLSTPTEATTLAAPTKTTTYRVTVTDGQSCELVDSVTIIVNEPTLPLQANLGFIIPASCAAYNNGYIEIMVEGGVPPYTYSWSGPDNFTAETEDIMHLFPGAYTLIVMDSEGSSTQAGPFTVEVVSVPVMIYASDTKLCSGSTITLNAAGLPALVSNGDDNPVYAWTSAQGKVKFSCTDCPNPVITVAENVAPGIYKDTCRVVLTDYNQCERTAEIEITVNVFEFSLIEALNVCMGDSLLIHPDTPFDPNGVYEWTGPNDFISNEAILKTENFTTGYSGLYTLTYTTELGCSAEASVQLTFNPRPDILERIVTPACGNEANGSIKLILNAQGAPYTVSWGTEATKVVEEVAVLSELTAGVYYITISNVYGCKYEDIPITVGSTPALEATLTTLSSCGTEQGGQVAVTVIGGTAPYIYNWSNEATTATIENLSTGIYEVTVTDANNCTKTWEAVVGGAMITGITQDTVLEEGESVTLSVEAFNGESITWSPSEGLAEPNAFTTLATPVVPTTYVATVTDGKDCEVKDSVLVLVLPKDYKNVRVQPVSMDATLEWCLNLPQAIDPADYGIVSITSDDEEQAAEVTYTQGELCFDYKGINFGVNVFDVTVCHESGAPCFTLNAIIEVYDTIVWPGDTDHNGVVNNKDVLNIGIANNAAGPKRTVSSTDWSAQYAPLWNESTPSTQTNFAHIDVDGNGNINLDDTLGVVRNWGLTASDDVQQPVIITPRDPGAPLFIDVDTVQMGTTVRLPIVLGVQENPALDAYGTAFTIQYDTRAIDPSTVSIEFVDSWIGNYQQDFVGLYKNFENEGKIEVAITRFNQKDVDGAGIIAYLVLQVREQVTDPVALFTVEAPVLIDAEQHNMPITPQETEVQITTSTFEPWLDSKITLFPNPAKDVINIRASDVTVENVILYHANGQMILQSKNTNSIEIESLEAGMYFCKIQTDKGLVTKRIVVVR